MAWLFVAGVVAVSIGLPYAVRRRFEGPDVENGPDYVVYLVPGKDRRAPGDGVFLASCRAPRRPELRRAGRDPADGPQTVLIWCRCFAAPVANAAVV